MTYVFRNNTIERFLRGEYQYSGYNDFSIIPDTDAYLWWYQVPIKHNISQLADEIKLFADKLQFIANQIGNKPLIIITIENICVPNVIMSDTRLSQAIEYFNCTAYSLANKQSNIRVIDFADFTNRYPSVELIDWKFYYLYQMPLNPRLANDFHQWFTKQQDRIALKRKKCLVLDLDNTLWAGILGEDGIEGISFDGDYPGKAFAHWQDGLKQLKQSGVMLAICSKNNASDVQEVWNKRTEMILKEEDFVAKRINWQDKATNIQSIAEELNIGLDSIVFVDDNPTERELVRQLLPMVEVPEWSSNPYDLPLLYNNLIEHYFMVYSITEEDKNKTEQYHQNALRQQQQSQFASFEDFVRSLNIELTIQPINDVTHKRVAQMTQKTNQFNLTTKRYTEDDIQRLITKGARIYTLSVADKFGDNGITGCMILLPNEAGWVIDTLLLSCRILGKGIEYAFVKYVLTVLPKNSIVLAEYYPTEKNAQVATFYDKLGFAFVAEDNMCKSYKISVADLDLQIEDYFTIK